MNKESNSTIVEIALQWNDSYNQSVFSFVNNINTHEGGTHMSGFATALTRVINTYMKKKKTSQQLAVFAGVEQRHDIGVR